MSTMCLRADSGTRCTSFDSPCSFVLVLAIDPAPSFVFRIVYSVDNIFALRFVSCSTSQPIALHPAWPVYIITLRTFPSPDQRCDIGRHKKRYHTQA